MDLYPGLHTLILDQDKLILDQDKIIEELEVNRNRLEAQILQLKTELQEDDIRSLKEDAARWRYTQQKGYFVCGPCRTDGDWGGYSVGIQPTNMTPIYKCIQGRGETLQEAIDMAIASTKRN
jgi:hypothetical protein